MSDESTQPEYEWSHKLYTTPEIWRSALLQLREQYQKIVDESRQRTMDEGLENVLLSAKLEVAHRIASKRMIEEIKEVLRQREERRKAERWNDFDALEAVIALDAILADDEIRHQAHDNFTKWQFELPTGSEGPL